MPELIWYGKRNVPLHVFLPFQTVETVDETVAGPQMRLQYRRERRSRQAWRASGGKHETAQLRGRADAQGEVTDYLHCAPDGSSVNLRMVWFVERGEVAPRLVTAYPLPRRQKPRHNGEGC